MTDYRRLRAEGGTYFFTHCLEDRSSSLLTMQIDKLRDAYSRTLAEMPVISVALVILPDHLHAIWRLPAGDSDFPERWRKIKARFSHSIAGDFRPGASKVAKRERGIWQRRYWEHMVRDDDDLAAHLRYCRGNPVKHGLVSDASEWPYAWFG